MMTNLQEAGGWGGMPGPSSTDNPVTMCSPNAAGTLADPGFDNPTFQILDTTTYALSQPLALTILLVRTALCSPVKLCDAINRAVCAII